MNLDFMNELLSKQNLRKLGSFILAQIKKVAQENLPGQEKKKEVVLQAKKFLKDMVEKIDFPGIDTPYDLALGLAIDVVVPSLVQVIYDFVYKQQS